MPILKGFSGSIDAEVGDTVDSMAGADDLIAKLEEYSANVYRISFTPSWTAGTRWWGADAVVPAIDGIDKVNYMLDNWGGYIIVDRNHHLTTDTVPLNPDNTWDDAGVLAGCYDVLAEWANNPRVLVEIVNEFVSDAGGTVWDHVEPIITQLKGEGYTNLFVINKHSAADDWTTIGADYYGKHFYMNNYTIPEFQGFMNSAITAGCIPMVNTEMGAHFAEYTNFTQALVDELEEDQLWASSNQIGYCIWLNKNIRNLTGVPAGTGGYEFYNWDGLV